MLREPVRLARRLMRVGWRGLIDFGELWSESDAPLWPTECRACRQAARLRVRGAYLVLHQAGLRQAELVGVGLPARRDAARGHGHVEGGHNPSRNRKARVAANFLVAAPFRACAREVEPILPSVDDTITFEIAPGEVVTRYVSAIGSIRYTADALIVELRYLAARRRGEPGYLAAPASSGTLSG